MQWERADLPPCLITIDRDGRWFHKGAEMVHREFIRLFFENLHLEPDGRYVIRMRGDACTVDVEDTAFVVQQVRPDRSGDGGEKLLLGLSDDTTEPLVPATLQVGADNVLYCRVKNGAFPARFLRPAYYQLAEFIVQEDDLFFLVLNGTRYPIAFPPAP